ncbi:MAG TPA: redoxin domain-containing protein [Gemmatimonadales bacterium]|nr:redoxin domain-containing protein [Gemmatimonadales bacterium]
MDAYRDQYATTFNGGTDVVLLAVSTDSPETLASWAMDADYPFVFLSDPDGAVGKAYGAHSATYGLDNRNLFVVTPAGTIGYRAVPFRETDPTAYTALAEAVDRIAGVP